MTLPTTARLETTPSTPAAAAGYFAARAAAAVDLLRAGPTRAAAVHTAGSRRARSRAHRARSRAERRALVAGGVAFGPGMVTGMSLDAAGLVGTTAGMGLWAALLAVAAGYGLTTGGRAARRYPLPPGLVLHGHAAAAYTAIVDGPARLRELDAAEHAVGRVEDLAPVAEHLAGVLAELRTGLVATGDPAGDTTGTPAHEQLLTVAGEVAALVERARDTRQAVAAHTHAALEPGSLADVDAQMAEEGAAARAALDRLG